MKAGPREAGVDRRLTAGPGELGRTLTTTRRRPLSTPARPAVTTPQRLAVTWLDNSITSNSTPVGRTQTTEATYRQLDTRPTRETRRRATCSQRLLAPLTGVPSDTRALEDVQHASASSSVETVALSAVGRLASLAAVAGRATAAVGLATAGSDARAAIGARL